MPHDAHSTSTQDDASFTERLIGWTALGLLVAVVVGYGLWLSWPRPTEAAHEAQDVRDFRDLEQATTLLGLSDANLRAGELTTDPARLAQARTLLDGLRRRQPGWARVYYLGGIERLLGRDLDAAERDLRRGLELDPGSIPLHLALGTVHFEKKDYDWAEEAFRRVVDRDPNNLAGLNNLGQTLHILGRREEALALYAKMRELEQGAAQAASPEAKASTTPQP
jgi:tetratricopeptide (TPR) repeat protein